MLKKSRLLVIGLLLFILLLTKQQVVEAATSSQQLMDQFEILPVLDQQSQRQGYFQLTAKNKLPKVITVKIRNTGVNPLIIKTAVNNATMGDNAVALYNDTQVTESLKHPLTQLLKVTQKTYQLAPGETKLAHFKLKPNKQPLIGTIAGAVSLYTQTSDQGSHPSTSLNNRVGYVIGVVIEGQALKRYQAPLIGLPRILEAGEQQIAIPLTNTNQAYLQQTRIKVKLTNGLNPFYKYQKQLAQKTIVPESHFNQLIDLSGKKIVTGFYRCTVTIQTKKQTWTNHQWLYMSQRHIWRISGWQVISGYIMIGFLILLVVIISIKLLKIKN